MGSGHFGASSSQSQTLEGRGQSSTELNQDQSSSLGKCCAPHFRSGQLLKGVLGAAKQSLSLRSVGRALLGAGMMAGQGGATRSSAGLAL